MQLEDEPSELKERKELLLVPRSRLHPLLPGTYNFHISVVNGRDAA